MPVRIFVLCALLLSACSLIASSEPLEILRVIVDGTEIVQVTPRLVRYRFSEVGGTLRSAFVRFAPHGWPPFDSVPGWGTGAQPTLAAGVSLPFEVWLGAETADLRTYTIETGPPDPDQPDQAVVRLTYDREGLQAAKEFQMRQEALYTLDVAIHIRAPGERIRLVLGHRPTGRDAPELVYIYDGARRTERKEAGTYTEFSGMGLVSAAQVFFLRLHQENVTPFSGANANGEPVFGVEATGELVVRGTLYTGRNRYLLLEKADIEVIAPVGLFAQFLVWVMRFFAWLYHLTGNYGWAIILFTGITRVVTHPLMRNQLRSMAKMQRLAPKLRKLQEKYKDDRQTLQQQMMELYRQEKVNPLGGCLPLLLQIPIMILLWQAIIYSAEQIHLSPGFLWLRDLSQPDPYYIMIVLATGAQILLQWLTQRRMPEPPAGGSQAIFLVLPLVTAILFLGFPSGVWMFWLLTNLFQIGQQLVVDLEMAREANRTPTPG